MSKIISSPYIWISGDSIPVEFIHGLIEDIVIGGFDVGGPLLQSSTTISKSLVMDYLSRHSPPFVTKLALGFGADYYLPAYIISILRAIGPHIQSLELIPLHHMSLKNVIFEDVTRDDQGLVQPAIFLDHGSGSLKKRRKLAHMPNLTEIHFARPDSVEHYGNQVFASINTTQIRTLGLNHCHEAFSFTRFSAGQSFDGLTSLTLTSVTLSQVEEVLSQVRPQLQLLSLSYRLEGVESLQTADSKIRYPEPALINQHRMSLQELSITLETARPNERFINPFSSKEFSVDDLRLFGNLRRLKISLRQQNLKLLQVSIRPAATAP